MRLNELTFLLPVLILFSFSIDLQGEPYCRTAGEINRHLDQLPIHDGFCFHTVRNPAFNIADGKFIDPEYQLEPRLRVALSPVSVFHFEHSHVEKMCSSLGSGWKMPLSEHAYAVPLAKAQIQARKATKIKGISPGDIQDIIDQERMKVS